MSHVASSDSTRSSLLVIYYITYIVIFFVFRYC